MAVPVVNAVPVHLGSVPLNKPADHSRTELQQEGAAKELGGRSIKHLRQLGTPWLTGWSRKPRQRASPELRFGQDCP